jgi:hypothetical protein
MSLRTIKINTEIMYILLQIKKHGHGIDAVSFIKLKTALCDRAKYIYIAFTLI